MEDRKGDGYAANWHYHCFYNILVNVFDFSPTRACTLAELQKKRAFGNPGPLLNEEPAFWILDAITDEAWQAATDWSTVEDIRSMFGNALQRQEFGNILDPSYDWVSAKMRCTRIIKTYRIEIADSHADLETRKVF